MGNVVKGLFGGAGDGGAKKAAEQSQQLQKVANDRQLASLQEDNKAVAATRRAPRGRRLFEDGGPDSATSVLG